MPWFDPSPAEMSVIEQIETAYDDPTLRADQRRGLLLALWAQLEAVHGERVKRLVSPEGRIIPSPLPPE